LALGRATDISNTIWAWGTLEMVACCGLLLAVS
jgi:hypothetical protein